MMQRQINAFLFGEFPTKNGEFLPNRLWAFNHRRLKTYKATAGHIRRHNVAWARMLGGQNINLGGSVDVRAVSGNSGVELADSSLLACIQEAKLFMRENLGYRLFVWG